MVGTVLLVMTEGFDDMSYLSTQVMLEESGFDVISSSNEGGAVKGETSSVMSVELNNAMSQDLDYSALVLVGGNNLDNISGLNEVINQFLSEGKVVAAIGSGVEIIESMGISNSLSKDNSMVKDGNLLTLKVPDDPELFIESLIEILS